MSSQPSVITVGIDATNLRQGGGVTHLVEILTAADNQGRFKVVIWGGQQTLAKLPERPWLEKVNPPELNLGILRRIWWQLFSLAPAAYAAGCSVLFVPGGSYVGNFRPTVTMSQNLLPFEWVELRRYGCSLSALKLLALRYSQSRSFRAANGVIFLTKYAKQAVLLVTGPLPGRSVVIPHGLNPRFQIRPKDLHRLDEYTEEKPCRLLYVSNVDHYKHQCHVVEAVHMLRSEGLSAVLELIGPANPAALALLHAAIARFDPEGCWVHYHGEVPYESVHENYHKADIGVYASSCETFGITLLEAMAASLPIACSNRSAMPEILGEAGLYFDPENPADIARAIRKYILDPGLRRENAVLGYERCLQYSWRRCADETFQFLEEVSIEANKGKV